MPRIRTLSTDGAAPYWSVEGLAEHWGCSTDSVRRMIARDELTAYRVGRLIRIHPRDADRAMRPVSTLQGGGEAA